MPDKPSDLIQGTLEMLILKTLALEPMHGYGVALRIEQTSNGVFRVNPGSLFPSPPSPASSVPPASRPSGELPRTIAEPSTTSSPIAAAKPSGKRPGNGTANSPPSPASSKPDGADMPILQNLTSGIKALFHKSNAITR
jgi:hypothetical protein